MSTWSEQQAKAILETARVDWGRGWTRLSDTQREDYIAHRVLLLMLAQEQAQFQPAQELVRQVLEAVYKRP